MACKRYWCSTAPTVPKSQHFGWSHNTPHQTKSGQHIHTEIDRERVEARQTVPRAIWYLRGGICGTPKLVACDTTDASVREASESLASAHITPHHTANRIE
jgi:hypothetical protein